MMPGQTFSFFQFFVKSRLPPIISIVRTVVYPEMASLEVPAASAPQIIRKNGKVLLLTAIQDLKSKVKSEVLVKGEDAYRAAIHR
jgi:hypothetical protein